MKWLLISLIRFYQVVLSPVLHALAGPMCGCRFYPTCSHYAVEALKKHGTLKGAWLAFKRILRCHPGCPGGVDPVPEVWTFYGHRDADGTSP